MDIYDFLGMITLGLYDKPKEEKSSVVVKEEYHVEQIPLVRLDFTPQTLDEYIGQTNAKLRINTYVKKVKTIKPIHLIISGTRGHGKSTLAAIIARQLGLSMETYVGGSFTIENLKSFLNKNQTSAVPMILFIDEIHGLLREVAEYMLPVLQSFILPEGNIELRKFILIGATTNLEYLQKSCAPFVDRCDILELEHYSAQDIKEILKQYNHNVYRKNITEEVYDLISKNTRFNPRTSLSVFDDLMVDENVYNVLKSRQIISNSLTIKDIIVLRHLAEIDKPVGVEVLAIITQQTKQTFMELQEPFLIQQGYISRSARGRSITEKGKELLRTIDG
jgi:Holliday junction DNA helicase RuvB